jgi:hypothetical protein
MHSVACPGLGFLLGSMGQSAVVATTMSTASEWWRVLHVHQEVRPVYVACCITRGSLALQLMLHGCLYWLPWTDVGSAAMIGGGQFDSHHERKPVDDPGP